MALTSFFGVESVFFFLRPVYLNVLTSLWRVSSLWLAGRQSRLLEKEPLSVGYLHLEHPSGWHREDTWLSSGTKTDYKKPFFSLFHAWAFLLQTFGTF